MSETQSKPGSNGCLALIAVGGLVLVVGMCSSSKDKPVQSFASPTLSNQIERMAPPEPAPIAPLDNGAIGKGKQHLRLALAAEGLSGAMIYSQNCYDSLSRSFSWNKLDQCGGFDLLAVKAADSADTEGLTAEVSYFGEEEAAGRYLAVATKAGEPAEEADKRLADLQQLTAKMAAPAPAPKATPTAEATPSDENGAEEEEAPANEGEEGADV